MRWIERFSKPENENWLIDLLGAWKLWLIGAALGVFLGLFFSLLFPSRYVAVASMQIDQNVEQVIPISRDTDLYLYFARETRKLEAFAFSDDVLKQIQIPNHAVSIQDLREEYLDLVPPGDGEWNLAASNSDPDVAVELARQWAYAFEDVLLDSMEVSLEMESVRAELILEAEKDIPDWDHIQALLDSLFTIMEDTSGISPYLEIELNQVEEIQAEPVISKAMAMMIGSIAGVLITFVYSAVRLTAGE